MALLFPKYRPSDSYLRPEKSVKADAFFDRIVKKIVAQQPTAILSSREKRFAEQVIELSASWQSIPQDQLDQMRLEWQSQVKLKGLDLPSAITGFALVRETSRRTLKMAHFPTQIMAGFVILTGRVAEMATGEGKTLMATLPAAVAAMSGIPTHVITVNDYLAQRDAEEMMPVYQSLGLSVGIVTSQSSPEERQQAYQQDIVYCTSAQLVFDYLKDQVTLQQTNHPLALHAKAVDDSLVCSKLLQRGLHFAVVDEADSVLVDEARTPLILSAKGELNATEVETYRQALAFAQQLKTDEYRLITDKKQVELYDSTITKLDACAKQHKTVWIGRIRREAIIKQALAALYLYHKDIDYIVTEEGKAEIIDPSTGRVMPDRSWSHGLHQLIELKENIEVRPPNKVLAKISYQRFFRRFCHLGGMSGTLKEVSKEISWVYGLKTVKIPTYRPSLRQSLGIRVYSEHQQRWQKTIESAQQYLQMGRSVLIATASLKESEELSKKLTEKAIEHQLLNAKQNAEEASIVALAGQSKCLTISTNMAGRGTDIKLSKEVKLAGGLHVIVTDLQEAARIDRQLIGRAARQGDPGSYEYLLSLDDAMLVTQISGGSRLFYSFFQKLYLSDRVRYRFLRFLQKRLEKRHEKARIQLLEQDEKQLDAMLFTGNRL